MYSVSPDAPVLHTFTIRDDGDSGRALDME